LGLLLLPAATRRRRLLLLHAGELEVVARVLVSRIRLERLLVGVDRRVVLAVVERGVAQVVLGERAQPRVGLRAVRGRAPVLARGVEELGLVRRLRGELPRLVARRAEVEPHRRFARQLGHRELVRLARAGVVLLGVAFVAVAHVLLLGGERLPCAKDEKRRDRDPALRSSPHGCLGASPHARTLARALARRRSDTHTSITSSMYAGNRSHGNASVGMLRARSSRFPSLSLESAVTSGARPPSMRSNGRRRRRRGRCRVSSPP